MSDTAKRMWSKNDITSIAEEDYVKKAYAPQGQQLVYLSSYNLPNDSGYVSQGHEAYTFPRRDANGCLSVSNPVKDDDAVNKGSLKTIFGNQSLVGSGNIDLYEHDITVTKETGKAYLTIYSSVNTKVDSLNDLKAITKNDTFTKSATGYIGSKIVVAITELNLLLADGTTELLTNTTFSDVVTTI